MISRTLKESVVSTVVGFVTSWVGTLIFVPIVTGHMPNWHQAIILSALFTGLSFAKAYWIRKYFKWKRRKDLDIHAYEHYP